MEPQNEISPFEKGPAATEHLPHDSMVTVRLSEPPSLHVDTHNSVQRKQVEVPAADEDEDIEVPGTPGIILEEADDDTEEESRRRRTIEPHMLSPIASDFTDSFHEEFGRSIERQIDRTDEAVEPSDEDMEEQVNWEELEKTEENEPKDESSDDSTAMLLARLEQENNLLATNPKSQAPKPAKIQIPRARGQSRPPSMYQLKKMVNGPTPPSLRYSMIPAPPMTDLEFYAALVQDYTRTAQCLPTLLSKKIRSGIPPPLRGVVWQSMAGARDAFLETEFDRLCGESSPYEGIIGKDLGRSFPGVEMFRDPEGDGQRMLGRVLKCFSLYDTKIGYCQGLGFLVGPLLMHMGDNQAFCVLVRLMEHYDLRSCFMPDLSGLHVRIYQFKQLLSLHLPALSAHLNFLQIEPSYVSQWFLSFFATTCPLPMLFRIYDVIFAEGASETIMRVALSLMRKNEEKIMACTEFEDVMQLLLSRGLWDVYHYNADEFVNEFVSMTGVVTRETLQALEVSYREAQVADVVAPSETIGSAASRFLGRLWIGGNSTKPVSLSPGLIAPSRPVSFLRRSPSKQSIASTLNSMEGGSSDSMLSSSTDATSISRDSCNDGASVRAPSVGFATKPNKDKNLHSQIEDLLMALSELQRDHAILATQLQREREERDEDRIVVNRLLDGMRKKSSLETVKNLGSHGTPQNKETVQPVPAELDESEVDSGDETIIPETHSDEETNLSADDLTRLLDVVEDRFSGPKSNRRSSTLQTKSQLRDDLARVKEQLIVEVSKTQEFTRQFADQQQQITNLTDQVREGHAHIRNAHLEKQRLERQIHEIRARKSSATTPDGSRDTESEWPVRSSNASGLREFKLGRTNSSRSTKTTFGKRTSSLPAARDHETTVTSESSGTSASALPTKQDPDHEAVVLQLVQAKTEAAMARQEADEAKAKLKNMKDMLGMQSASSDIRGASGHTRGSPSQASQASIVNTSSGGYFARPTPHTQTVATKVENSAPATASSGFWGGWGKRAVSASAE